MEAGMISSKKIVTLPLFYACITWATGMDEAVFLEKVRNAAEACFIEAFSGLAEEDREEYGYYDYLKWTVSDEAVNFDLPIFVDAVGNLCVMGRIGSMAGASEFWAPLYPFAEFHGFDNAVG